MPESQGDVTQLLAQWREGDAHCVFGIAQNRRELSAEGAGGAYSSAHRPQVLVDHARAVGAEKRGGNLTKVRLNEAVEFAPDWPCDFLALNEALDLLARLSPRKAEVIELRYFGGLNVEETAEVLEISIATVSREQRMAEAWLSRAMTESGSA